MLFSTSKKIIYGLFLSLVAVSGLVFINCEGKNETSKKSNPKPMTIAEKKAALKKWEASPDGIMVKKWEASPAGQKVIASSAKISKSVKDFTAMEATVTSLTLPPGSRLGFAVMVNINGDDYILSFGIEQPGKNSMNLKNEFELLRTLQVNDKISIKSHSVSKAPKYSYPIISGDYIERDGTLLYKRTPRKDGC